jgi:hypothetical protein
MLGLTVGGPASSRKPAAAGSGGLGRTSLSRPPDGNPVPPRWYRLAATTNQ